MIEQVMIFSLGFLSATLLALACLPAVWNRALRLSKRRLSQLVPLSMDEIVAERDQMRAGFAVELRRVEQKLERAETARGEALAELGRSASSLAGATADLDRATHEAADLAAKLAATQAELRDVQGQAGSHEVALHDVTALAEKRRWELLDAQGQVRALAMLMDEGRATVAGLELKVAGLEHRVADLRRTLAAAEARTLELAEDARAAVASRDAADFPALRAAIDKVADDVLRLAQRPPGSARPG